MMISWNFPVCLLSTGSGDEYKALKITINLDSDEIFLEGSVSGTIYTEDEESDQQNGDDMPPEEEAQE